MVIILGAKIGFSQNVIQYVPQYIEQQYVPQHDIQLLQNALQARQAAYDANKNYLYSIQNWILDAKTEHPSSSQLLVLNKYYKKLEDLKDKDLSLLGNDLQEIALQMKKELIETQGNDSVSKTSRVMKKTKAICYIMSQPTYSSQQLTKIPVGQYVEFIESVDVLWCAVRVNNTVGYTLKSGLILKQ